jgi:hypothetical protein
MLVSIRQAKTDRTGLGETLAIAYGDREGLCAVRALRPRLPMPGSRTGSSSDGSVPATEYLRFSTQAPAQLILGNGGTPTPGVHS